MIRPPALLLALLLATPVALPAAQLPSAPAGLQPVDPNDPVDRLGRYLRILSTAPRDLEALTGAGRAALEVGDANAAIGFYARAEEIAPRDGRIKAGLAAALVQMEQPKQALKLFAQAVDLGVPAGSLAADRGLAYDLTGDTRRAQADYALSLRTAPDDETVRRLALSQAMAGDRAAALATLDPLLRRQDKAAWRASTFVLAMTGDRAAATARLGQLVTPQQASALAPFLAELPGLKPAQQARAVHFGHLPASAQPSAALASAEPAAPPPASAANAVPAPTRSAEAAAASLAPRRRPGSEAPGDAATPPAGRPSAHTALALAESPRVAPPVSSTVASSPTPSAAVSPAIVGAPPPATSLASAAVAASVPRASPQESDTARSRAPSATLSATPSPGAAAAIGPVDPRFVETVPSAVAATNLPASRAAPPSANAAPTATPATTRFTEPPSAHSMTKPEVATRLAAAEPAAARRGAAASKIDVPAPANDRSRRTRPAEVDAERAAPAGKSVTARTGRDVQLVDADGARDAKAAKEPARKGKDKAARPAGKEDRDDAKSDARGGKARTTREAEAKPADAKAEKAKQASAASKAPQRYWVQVATGAYKADLPKSWRNVKAKYPQLMAGRTPWTTPLRFTNRVLVGPFRSSDEAQAFVNTAAKAGFGTSLFASAPGQAVERLGEK